jgi:hypothetical protein
MSPPLPPSFVPPLKEKECFNFSSTVRIFGGTTCLSAMRGHCVGCRISYSLRHSRRIASLYLNEGLQAQKALYRQHNRENTILRTRRNMFGPCTYDRSKT